MQKQKQRQTEYWKNILRVVSCPYQGQKMAFCMKSIFAVLWLISIPNGIFFHASRDYLIVLSYLTSVLLINLFVCRHHYHRWIDVVTAACLLVGVFYVFFHGCIGYFSVMFPLLFSCIAVFMLGIRNSVLLNLITVSAIIYCLRVDPDMVARKLYGENVTLRFPYLYICIVLITYLLMYTIQSYWVEKTRREEILKQRIQEEKDRLQGMAIKTMRAMGRALDAKIPGEEAHGVQVAEYAKKLAIRSDLDETMQNDAYQAGLLHEIGMIGIPDALILCQNMTPGEYAQFCTYVEKGYGIICQLQGAGNVAEAVLYHRENYDGSGYLKGLQAEEIPCLARILAVADYTSRHIQRGETAMDVIEALKKEKNKRFDGRIADDMIEILRYD